MAKRKPERNLSLEEVRQALAVGLRDKVNAVAEKFKDLKRVEVGHKLGKHELCPLCGNADVPGACTCIGLSKSTPDKAFAISKATKKNEIMGYGGGDQAQGGMAGGEGGMAMMEKGVGGDMDKAELEKCGSCGSMHKSGDSYDHEMKKEEKSPGAVLPDDKKVKATGNDEGSGGKVKKLAKGFGGAAAPAHPHADTMASLKDVASLAPKAQSPVIRANQQMAKFKSIASNPMAMPGNTPLANPKAMTGHAVSGEIQAKPVMAAAPKPAAPAIAKPDALSQVRTQLNTDAKRPNDALQAVRDKMNLDADKKAGGVGWLNSLISRFRKPQAAPIGTGPVRSQMGPYQGVRGAAALARSEGNQSNDLVKSLGDCALCRKPEHLGNC